MVDKNNSPSAFRCRTHVGLIRWRTCGGFVHQLRRRPPRSPGTRCGRALHPFGRWRWRNAGSLGLTGSYYPRRQNDQAAWRPESSCIHHDYRVEVLTEKKSVSSVMWSQVCPVQNHRWATAHEWCEEHRRSQRYSRSLDLCCAFSVQSQFLPTWIIIILFIHQMCHFSKTIAKHV